MIAHVETMVDVIVYCDEPSHDERPYLVAAMCWSLLDRNGDEHRGVPEGVDPATLQRLWTPKRRIDREAGKPFKLKGSKVRQALSGNGVYIPRRDAGYVDMSQVRGRYKFRCATCGLSLTRKAPVVDAVLDVLSRNGVETITLKGLAAIV